MGTIRIAGPKHLGKRPYAMKTMFLERKSCEPGGSWLAKISYPYSWF